jgi:hypothetical protein
MVSLFKFLKGYNHKTLRQPIIDKIYELCKVYSDYILECREEHLRDNPQDVGRDDYGFPIYYHRIEFDFFEGQLWHGGTDYNEIEDKLEHFLFFDMRSRTHEDLYITVHETNEGQYIITNIEEDESRWQ